MDNKQLDFLLHITIIIIWILQTIFSIFQWQELGMLKERIAIMETEYDNLHDEKLFKKFNLN